MSKIDFFRGLSRFARTCRNTISRRITHAYGRISQTCQKKLSKNENIFWWCKKEYLFLWLNSWATFSEAQELKKHNEIANFARFLFSKCWKFQMDTRISKMPQACGFYLFVSRVIQQPRERIMFNPFFLFV